MPFLNAFCHFVRMAYPYVGVVTDFMAMERIVSTLTLVNKTMAAVTQGFVCLVS